MSAAPQDHGQGPATAEGRLGEALRALREGRPVLVTDDVYRENEGDVILAAETLTTGWLGWTIRHSSGYVCAPMPGEWADRLSLPLMVADNEDPLRTAYTVTVDAAEGIGTGISAADRARTIQVLGDRGSRREDLIRPGHVLPLRARRGGVLERAGHTEAAVDLCRLAGLTPVAAIAELVDDEGEMLRGPQVRELGQEHGLPVLTIAELSHWRLCHDRVERVATTRLPTEHGTFRAVGYRDVMTGAEHIALVAHGPQHPGGQDPGPAPVVRVHSECLTGDTLGSRRCDCGPQLHQALALVGREGGVVVYLRGHEGRGVGLLDKLRAYAVQDTGPDTVDAQHALGLPVDAREYGAASAILRDLGIEQVRLVTHNPAKVAAMVDGGIEVVEVLPSEVTPALEAVGYLRTKRERLGHATLPEHQDHDAGPAAMADDATTPTVTTQTAGGPHER